MKHYFKFLINLPILIIMSFPSLVPLLFVLTGLSLAGLWYLIIVYTKQIDKRIKKLEEKN